MPSPRASARSSPSSVDGLPNAAIAARLCITQNTLEHHLTHLYAKLGVSSRAQAAVHALRHQLVPIHTHS